MDAKKRIIELLNEFMLSGSDERIAKSVTAYENEDHDFSFLNKKDALSGQHYHSLHIRFGNCLESITKAMLGNCGFTMIDVKKDFPGFHKDVDTVFELDDKIYVFEIKAKDNHDSTKKVGQLNDLISKGEFIKNAYGKQIVLGFYFIDGLKRKNRKYYSENLPKGSFLLYGNEFWSEFGLHNVHDFITETIAEWKKDNYDLVLKMVDKHID